MQRRARGGVCSEAEAAPYRTYIEAADVAVCLVADLWLEGHVWPSAEAAAASVGLRVLWADRCELVARWCAPGSAVLDPDLGLVYVRRGLTHEAEARAIGHEIGHWLARRRGWPAEVEELWADAFGAALAEALTRRDA
jgi:hypothetical protein